jgi:hypothetical protein
MISERKFAASYTSFWNQVLPRVDGYLRRINGLCERYEDEIPVTASAHRDRRAIVNELGFRLFQAACAEKHVSDRRVREIAESVRQYVERLSKENDGVVREPVAEKEIDEAAAISASLKVYFKGTPIRELLFWPQFPGCGILHATKGDIIHGKKLYEVKAGDRSFRVTDMRQILTYCAMDFSAGKYGIEEVVLLNPRRGTHFCTSIDQLVKESSGGSPVDFFSNVIEFLSAETNSR